MSKTLHIIALSALVIVALAVGASATEYIVNGGFETGDYAGWTSAGCGPASVSTGFDGWKPHSGNYFSGEGAVGCDHTLSQTFADTAGQLLTISFWYGSDGGKPNDLNVWWDGNLIYTEANRGDTRPNYLLYAFNVTATGTDTLMLGIRNVPSYQALDDVSVTNAIPEPSTLALLGSSLAGLGIFRRRFL